MVGKTRLQLAQKKPARYTSAPLSGNGAKSGAKKDHEAEISALDSGVTANALQLQSMAGNRAVQRLIQRETEDELGSSELFNVPGVQLPTPGGGKTLPDDLRDHMEESFGHSFEDVRVYEDTAPDSVGAIAYTQGNDIHFSPGQYRPDSESGRSLVGHELTHVVQQRSGMVATPQGSGAPVNASPELEDEADRIGRAAATGSTATVSGAGSGVQRAVDPVQRQEEEELMMDSGGGGRARSGSQIDPDAFKAIAAFWKSKDASKASQTEVAAAVPDVASYVVNPPAPSSAAPTADEQSGLDSAIKAAEQDPETVIKESGLSETEVQSEETEQEEVLVEEHQEAQAESQTSTETTAATTKPPAKLKDADTDTQQQASQDLNSVKKMAAALVQMLQSTATQAQTATETPSTPADPSAATPTAPSTPPPAPAFSQEEVEGVVAHEVEERSEERTELGLEQMGMVAGAGEGYKELGSGGAWKGDAGGYVAGAGALVGSAATLYASYKSVKDGYETLIDDSLDMQARVDAVGQITEAISDVGGVTASLTELIGAWDGASKAFQEAAGNWGAAFGIVTGSVGMIRSGVSGGLAHHRIKKLKKIKDRRGKESGAQSEQLAEAASEAIDTNKARRKNAVINFAKGGVTLAAGILALAGAGPVGWGIAAGVGLVSAIWAGFKFWKRKHQDPEVRKQELFKQLQVAKLIERGISITQTEIDADPSGQLESVREDYRQIALKLGAPKKKVMKGTYAAKNIAKLMSRH